MQHLRHDDNAHLVLTYEDDGATVTLEGDLAWATLETEHSYDNFNSESVLDFRRSIQEYSYKLEFAPAGHLRVTYGNAAVKEYTVTRTAEIEASGSTVAAFESARERVGAPKDALMQIDRWSYPEAIQITADEPVKVRFTWEETVV